MTNDEVVAKFLHNAEGVVGVDDQEWVADRVLHLDEVEDVHEILRRLHPTLVTTW